MAEAKTPAAKADAAETKSAADILVEMQLEEKRRLSINPLVVTEDTVVVGETTEDGTSISARRVFADGAVLESYA
ncbi:MAG: hypothetical protein EAZ84_00385 [Verrucomicrobia bacterium]|nr:MAG: hypothetical protein EAZ84_00385 [Verrucomicrobiota bacterium]